MARVLGEAVPPEELAKSLCVRREDQQGLTCLQICVVQGHLECMETLLDVLQEALQASGADVKKGVAELLRETDNMGYSALHLAGATEAPEFVKLLLRRDRGLFTFGVGGQRGGLTALEVAVEKVEKQNSGSVRALAEHLAQGLERGRAWAKAVAQRVMTAAVEQRDASALRILTECLPRGAEHWWVWEAGLEDALALDSARMVEVLASAFAEVVSAKFLATASQRKSFCSLVGALSKCTTVLVPRRGRDMTWVPMAHLVRTPRIMSCKQEAQETRDLLKLTAEQQQHIEGTPWYVFWGRPNLCVTHQLPRHLLSDSSLQEVLLLLALNPNVEVFRTPFAQGVVTKAWKRVRRFYYIDIVLNVGHIVVAVALTRQPQAGDWVARRTYFQILLAGVSPLVFKEILDETFQLFTLRTDYLKLSENWFDFFRVCTEMAAVTVLWLELTDTISQILVAAWVGWLWIHTLTDLRGLHGVGHQTIPILQAIFDLKVLALGLVLFFCIMGATHFHYVFAELSDPYDAFRKVFGLALLGDLDPWDADKDEPGYEVNQGTILGLSFVFIVPLPLFISVVGNAYNRGEEEAVESFFRERAMLAVEYNVAALPCLLRYLCCFRQPDTLADDEVEVLLSQEPKGARGGPVLRHA